MEKRGYETGSYVKGTIVGNDNVKIRYKFGTSYVYHIRWDNVARAAALAGIAIGTGALIYMSGGSSGTLIFVVP